MLLMPYAKASGYNGAERHVEWLRGQLKGEANEAIELAINSALGSDSHNLQLFLEAFVEAYLQESSAEDGTVYIDKVLFEILHRHWKQLIIEGVVPYLSLKTLQVRTSLVRDRVGSIQFLLQNNEINKRFLLSWAQQMKAPTSALVSVLISLSVVPRGP